MDRKKSSLLSYKGAVDRETIASISLLSSSDESESEYDQSFEERPKPKRGPRSKKPVVQPLETILILSDDDDDENDTNNNNNNSNNSKSRTSMSEKKSKLELEDLIGPIQNRMSMPLPTNASRAEDQILQKISSKRQQLMSSLTRNSISPQTKTASKDKIYEEIDPEDINVTFKNASCGDKNLIVASDEPFKQIFQRYCDTTQIPIFCCKFTYDYEPIKETQKPSDLAMMDNDIIDVEVDDLKLQLSRTKTVSLQNDEKSIKLRVRKGKELHKFKVNPDDPLSKLFEAFAQKIGEQPSSLKFRFDGDVLDPKKNPTFYDMDDDDLIDG